MSSELVEFQQQVDTAAVCKAADGTAAPGTAADGTSAVGTAAEQMSE